MQRILALVLSAWFIVLGTGAVRFVHLHQHEQESHAVAESGTCDHDHHPQPQKKQPGNDSSCPLCAQLLHPNLLHWAAPAMLPTASQLGCITLTAIEQPFQAACTRIDCRGPPAFPPLR